MKRNKTLISEYASTYTLNIRRIGRLARLITYKIQSVDLSKEQLKKRDDETESKAQIRITKLKSEAREIRDGINLFWTWQIVMLVTFVETYLQDVLTAAAIIDPSLVKDSKLSATYDEIITSRDISSLSTLIVRRWASRNFVDAGPTKWVERLRQMGASKLDKSLSPELEQLWGIRHLIVHQAAIVNEEFKRIHPQLGGVVGQELKLTKDQITKYHETANEFVLQIDHYLCKRFPKLMQTQ